MAREGLKSVRFRSIGMRLGVDPKAIYTYVADKDDLLTGMFEATLSALELPQPGDPRAPVDQLVDLLSSLRRALIVNADLLHLVSRRVSVGTAAAAEGIWAALLAIVPDLDRAAELYTYVVQLTIGSALESVQHRAAAQVPTGSLSHLDLDVKTASDLAAYSQAMARVDRDRLFDKTLRAVLQQAGS
jgi:AcrR family transcriptional regulator